MTKNQGKREMSASLITHHISIYRCPICSAPMQLVEAKSLVCSNRHCFDLARQGYVNFLLRPHKTKYNKQLFRHRKIISHIGFFAPLTRQIGDLIIAHKRSAGGVKILDAGCGEGSLLSGLLVWMDNNGVHECLGVGLDISKEGVAMAPRQNVQALWCVADLAQSPLASQQFDFIVNILSPSNYAEFQRLLTDAGMLIKIVPGSRYLQELREIFYHQGDQRVYSARDTIELFADQFGLYDKQQLTYSFCPDQALMESLIHMTPLSWGAPAKRLQKALEAEIAEVTVDFTILLGKKKAPSS